MERTSLGSTHAQWVLSQLNQQRVLGKFCDVLLKTPNGQVFPAHRNILACFSQVFHEPISTATPCMEISLPEACTDDGLEMLLSFFYTGELQLNSENVGKVRDAATGLSVPDSLLPAQGSDCTEDTKGNPPSSWPAVDGRPDPASKGQSKARLRVKNKAEIPDKAAPAVPELEDSSSAILTTTTRSGRRIKGPSRLVGESPMSAIQKLGASRRRASKTKAEGTITTEDDQSSVQDSSVAEVINLFTRFGTISLNAPYLLNLLAGLQVHYCPHA